MKNLILIKLGGSVITEKSARKKANIDVIEKLAGEISAARKKTNDLIIIAHGQGSFAHVPAKKYRTKQGNIAKNSAYGAAMVRQECIELNSLVLNCLLKAGLPAVTFAPNSFLTTAKGQLSTVNCKPLTTALKSGLIPVVYGDVIPDEKIGWTIYSGEQVLNALALKLKGLGFKPKRLIEVGLTDGVYDEQGKTIPEINRGNLKSFQRSLGKSHGTDVTGGMEHKVKEALGIAKLGIPTLLIPAKPGNLQKAILGQNVPGTWIK